MYNRQSSIPWLPLLGIAVVAALLISIFAIIKSDLAINDSNRARAAFNHLIIARSERDAALEANDLATLQFALFIKYTEITLYTIISDNYTNADFMAEGFPNGTYDMFVDILGQKTAHGNAFFSSITLSSNTPLPTCNYVFNTTNLMDQLNLILYFETLGGDTFIALLNAVSNTERSELIGKIFFVESQHSAFLNVLLLNNPSPDIFGQMIAPIIYFQNANAYITSCPYASTQLVYPVSRSSIEEEEPTF